jgi:hypothetical protein
MKTSWTTIGVLPLASIVEDIPVGTVVGGVGILPFSVGK